MTIGLIILGVLAVLLFFGTAERYFDRLGLTSWLTFLLILALIIGAVMPEVSAGAFVMTVGGFAVPLVVFVILFVFAAKEGNALRAVLSVLLVMVTTVAFRLLLGVDTAALVLTTSLLIGFVGGALAFLGAGSRIATLAGALGGCILGDVVSSALLRALFGYATFTMGGYGIFDAMIIAAAFGLAVAEIVAAVRRSIENKRAAASGLNMEAGEDVKTERREETAEFSEDAMFDVSEAEAKDMMDVMPDDDEDKI